MREITAGEVIATTLKAEGVEHVFGIPDGTYLSFITALRKHRIGLITHHDTNPPLHTWQALMHG